MALWHSLALWIFHALYTLSELIIAVKSLLHPGSDFGELTIEELQSRGKTPGHLAVAFTSSRGESSASDEDSVDNTLADVLLESSRRVMHWCSHVGIGTLTLYDRHGVLKAHVDELARNPVSLPRTAAELRATPAMRATESNAPINAKQRDTHAYLTPPPSDDSGSNSLVDGVDSSDDILSFTYFSNHHTKRELDSWTGSSDEDEKPSATRSLRRRKQTSLTPSKSSSSTCRVRVNVISADDGLPAIAQAARTLAHSRARSSKVLPRITIQELDDLVCAELISPHLLIQHNVDRPSFPGRNPPSRSLDAFPPWQLRLTEIHFTQLPYTLTGLVSSLLPGRSAPQPSYSPLDSRMFATALSEYAAAEMREGK